MIVDPTRKNSLPNALARGLSRRLVSNTLEERQDDAVERHLFPSVQLSSSTGLGWKDIIVGHYLTDPGEKPEVATTRRILSAASGKEMCFGERRGQGALDHRCECPCGRWIKALGGG
jgi:hypothetical protein